MAGTREVGVRELRDNLSRYLVDVQNGVEVVVTDHRRPVARLVPVEGRRDRLAELIRRGAAQPAKRPAKLPRRLKGFPIVSDLISEQRR